MTLRRYEPAPAPLEARTLPEYVLRELRRIASTFQEYAEALQEQVRVAAGLSLSASTEVKLDVGALSVGSASLSDKTLLAYDASAGSHLRVRVSDVTALASGGGSDPRYDPRQSLWIVEDFLYPPGTSGQGGWDALVNNGTVAEAALNADMQGHPGVIALSTGVTATSYAGVLRHVDAAASTGGIYLAGAATTIDIVFRFQSVPTPSLLSLPRLGLVDELTATPGYGVFVTATFSGVYRLQLAYAHAGSLQATSSLDFTVSASVWYHARIEINTAADVSVLSIQPQGGARQHIATLSRTLAVELLNPGAQYAAVTGSAAQALWLDLMVVSQTFVTPRWT